MNGKMMPNSDYLIPAGMHAWKGAAIRCLRDASSRATNGKIYCAIP